MAYSVFVSYSTQDLATADALCSWIRQAGAEAFLAEYSVIPSAPLADEIVKAAKNCDLFVLLWSQNARGSEWVPQEIGIAKGLNKPIVPVVLNDGLELPGFIRDLKYLPLHKDPNAGVRWLHDHVVGRRKKKEQDALVALGVFGALLLLLAKASK